MLEMKFNFSFRTYNRLSRLSGRSTSTGVPSFCLRKEQAGKALLRYGSAVDDNYLAIHKAVAVAAHERGKLGKFARPAKAAF